MSDNNLIDIQSELNSDKSIKDNDIDDVISIAGEMAVELIEMDPMRYMNPDFHKYIYDQVYRETYTILEPAYPGRNIEHEVFELVTKSLKICFAHVLPARSYRNTIVEHLPNVNKTHEKIKYLDSVPQEEQRTTGWYEQRHKYLTASSIWKAFGTPGNRNEIIFSKCNPIDISKYSRFNLESPLHWGQKYEDLSIAWYENEYNTRVGEFGCIPHSTIPYIAASPDGINVDPSAKRYGRMVEVKNIFNREITGIPKKEYWIQMQIQLEVCNLQECDFLETRFKEYESEEEFEKDGSFTKTIDGKPKGKFVLFLDEHGQPKYDFPPWGVSKTDYDDWEHKTMTKNSNLTWLKTLFWRLDQVSLVLVVRNKLWFNSAKPILDDLWNTITLERKNGYAHRAPNKRKRMQVIKEKKKPNKCMIKLTKDNPTKDNPTKDNPTKDNPTKENHVKDNNEIFIDTEKLENTIIL
jgi:putative phage-type endonuclease